MLYEVITLNVAATMLDVLDDDARVLPRLGHQERALHETQHQRGDAVRVEVGFRCMEYLRRLQLCAHPGGPATETLLATVAECRVGVREFLGQIAHETGLRTA